jgi:hypothetical protein
MDLGTGRGRTKTGVSFSKANAIFNAISGSTKLWARCLKRSKLHGSPVPRRLGVDL